MKKAKPKKRTIKRTRKTRIKELSRIHGKANVTRRGKVKKSKKYNVKKTPSRIKRKKRVTTRTQGAAPRRSGWTPPFK